MSKKATVTSTAVEPDVIIKPSNQVKKTTVQKLKDKIKELLNLLGLQNFKGNIAINNPPEEKPEPTPKPKKTTKAPEDPYDDLLRSSLLKSLLGSGTFSTGSSGTTVRLPETYKKPTAKPEPITSEAFKGYHSDHCDCLICKGLKSGKLRVNKSLERKRRRGYAN